MIFSKNRYPPPPSRGHASWDHTLGCGRATAGQARDQDGDDARQEYAVESPSAADRGDGGAQALDLIEIEKVGADQRPQAASAIGKRRRGAPGNNQGNHRRGQGRRPERNRNADARNWRCQMVANQRYAAGRKQPRPQTWFFARRWMDSKVGITAPPTFTAITVPGQSAKSGTT